MSCFVRVVGLRELKKKKRYWHCHIYIYIESYFDHTGKSKIRQRKTKRRKKTRVWILIRERMIFVKRTETLTYGTLIFIVSDDLSCDKEKIGVIGIFW